MSKFSTWIELLSYRAIHQADKIAYIFLQEGEKETLRLSYQQLDTLSRAIASQLQSLELTGERALLLYPPGLEFIAAFFWMFICWRDSCTSLSTPTESENDKVICDRIRCFG